MSAAQLETKKSGLIISFGYTCHELQNCGKCVTRRDWKDNHAAKFIKAFNQGAYVKAFDKDVRRQGEQIGWLRLTTEPYQEALADMPGSDVELEGFPGLSKEEFLSRFFKKFNLAKPIWVVRFEYFKEVK